MDFMEDFYPIPWFEDMDMNGSGLHGVLLHDEDPLMPVYGEEEEPLCKRRRSQGNSEGSSVALMDHNYNHCVSSKLSTEEDPIHPIVLRFLKGECSVVKGQDSCIRVPPILGASIWIENVDERPKEAESDRGSASSSPTYTSDVPSASPRIRGFSSNNASGGQNPEVSSRKRGRPPAGANRSNSMVISASCPSSNASSNCLPAPSSRTVLGARGKKCVLSSENTVVVNTGAASSGYSGRKCESGARSTSSSGQHCGAKSVGRPGSKPTGSRGGKSASAPTKKKGGAKSNVPLTPEEQQKKLEKNRQKALKEKERRRRSKDLLDQVKAYLIATFPNLLGRRTSHQRLIDTLLQLLPSLHYQHAVVKRHHALAKKHIKKWQ